MVRHDTRRRSRVGQADASDSPPEAVPHRVDPIPLELMERFEARTRLDGIGPAYFVSMDVLPIVNATATISFEESADGKEHDDE